MLVFLDEKGGLDALPALNQIIPSSSAEKSHISELLDQRSFLQVTETYDFDSADVQVLKSNLEAFVAKNRNLDTLKTKLGLLGHMKDIDISNVLKHAAKSGLLLDFFEIIAPLPDPEVKEKIQHGLEAYMESLELSDANIKRIYKLLDDSGAFKKSSSVVQLYVGLILLGKNLMTIEDLRTAGPKPDDSWDLVYFPSITDHTYNDIVIMLSWNSNHPTINSKLREKIMNDVDLKTKISYVLMTQKSKKFSYVEKSAQFCEFAFKVLPSFDEKGDFFNEARDKKCFLSIEESPDYKLITSTYFEKQKIKDGKSLKATEIDEYFKDLKNSDEVQKESILKLILAKFQDLISRKEEIPAKWLSELGCSHSLFSVYFESVKDLDGELLKELTKSCQTSNSKSLLENALMMKQILDKLDSTHHSDSFSKILKLYSKSKDLHALLISSKYNDPVVAKNVDYTSNFLLFTKLVLAVQSNDCRDIRKTDFYNYCEPFSENKRCQYGLLVYLFHCGCKRASPADKNNFIATFEPELQNFMKTLTISIELWDLSKQQAQDFLTQEMSRSDSLQLFFQPSNLLDSKKDDQELFVKFLGNKELAKKIGADKLEPFLNSISADENLFEKLLRAEYFPLTFQNVTNVQL